MRRAVRTGPLFFGAAAAMFVFGLVLAVLGTVFGLPEMRARLHVDLAQQGNLFLLQYLGVFVASMIAGPLIDSVGNRLVLLVSALLVTAGLVGFAGAHSFFAAALAALPLGLGGGGLNTSANALVSSLYAESRAAMLNLLGVFFGFGALFVPLVAASIAGWLTIPQLLIASAALALACVLLYALLKFPPPLESSGVSFLETLRVARYPGVLWLALLLFFESGNEASIGGWTSTYVGATGLSPRTATFVLALYWAALMLARVAASRVLARIGKPQLILASSLGSAAGCALLVTAHSALSLAFGTAMIGLSFAAIFPTVLGIAGDRYPRSAGSVFGLLFSVALLGGMAEPWAVGQLSQRFAIRYGMFVPLIGTLVICLVAVSLVRSQVTSPAVQAEGARQEASTTID
jgi:fucose permease